jgi:hypothetical protein
MPIDYGTNNVTSSGNVNVSGIVTATSGVFSNLTFNGTVVSISGHTHTAANITDFDSAVSGLLPVKNILAGYDINITNNSGVYTVASTNLVHVDSQQPQGFVNRTDSRISVSGNIFRIEPTGSSYSYYNKGIKVVKTSGDSLTIPNLTQINYIHFDTSNNQISNKITSFNFDTDIPIAYVAWNSGVGPSGQMTFFAEERHGIVMDTSTHKWIHYTFGAQYVDGLSISNYSTSGNGSSNSDATIAIGNGTLFQEDIVINITDSSSTDPFCQELSPIAQIPVYYHQGTTGQWVKNTATDYPVKYGANGPQYNSLSDDNWTILDVSPGGATRYFAVWILATNQIDDPIISIMGQRVDSNQGSAESNNSWSDVNLTNLPLSEVKPLYRLIFAGDSDYTNVPKCRLVSILDIRVAVISTIAGVTQNDHGSLFGLIDDDHSQYVHINIPRTVEANHTFTNGLTISSGLLSAASGNFTSLTVNGTGVSISGHTHTSSNITDFNSVVSGLFPSNLVTGTGLTNHIAYWSNSGVVSADSGQLYWDSTNNRLGIGTSSPSDFINISGSTGSAAGIKFDNSDGYGGSIQGDNASLYFYSNNSTLVYSNKDNKIRMNDGGATSTAIELTSNGSISQDGNGGGLTFSGTTAKLSSGLHVTAGNVGIGTVTPSSILDISQNDAILKIGDNSSNAGTGPRIQITSKFGATDTSAFLGYSYFNNKTYLQHGRGDAGGIELRSANGTPRLYMQNSNGNIGIGTTSPNSLLEVSGNIQQTWLGSDIRMATVFDNNWRMGINYAASQRILNIFSTSNDTNGHISFLTRLGSGTSATDYGTERMRITNSGFVGIGTTTPSGQLHVIGSGIFSSGIRVGDSSTNGYIYGPSGNMYIQINGAAGNRIDFGSNTYSNSSVYFGSQFTYLNSQSTYVNGTLQFPAANNDPTSTATQRDSNSIIIYNKLWNGSSVASPGNEIVSKASTTTNLLSRLAFLMHNGDGSQNRTERFSVLSNGNIGIGTISPSGRLHVDGLGVFNSGVQINNQVADCLVYLDGNKQLTSLATTIYPTIAELSYIKGVTSSIQTQLNAKQGILTNPITGTGAVNHIAYWTSTSGIAHDANQLVWDATNNRLGVGVSSVSGAIHTNSDPGQWGANNYGCNLLIQGSRNNGIGIYDGTNSNPIAIVNNAGNIRFAHMPAVGVTGTFPNDRLIIDTAGNTMIGSSTPSEANGGKFGVVNGNSYLYACDSAYQTFTLGPRKANDGFSTVVIYPTGLKGTGGQRFWSYDYSNGGINLSYNITGITTTLHTTATNGDFGLGTTSPIAKLHAVGSGYFTSDIYTSGRLVSSQSTGDEGGEIVLARSATNSSISGSITIDINQNRLRFFETTGSNRGYYLDITEGAPGVATPLRIRSVKDFTALDNQPPATLFATLDTRNSIPVLDFDAASTEYAVFGGFIQDGANLTSGLHVNIHWTASTATNGNCVWQAEFKDMDDDLDSITWGTPVTGISLTNATNGAPTTTTISLSSAQIDNLVAGDFFLLRIARSGGSASDTMVGDAELIALEVETKI